MRSLFRADVASTLTPGSIVVLDHLGNNKGKAVRQTIRKAGAHLLFLPLNSLDLNPFEQLFSKNEDAAAKDQ